VVRNTTNAKTDNHQLKRIWAMDNKTAVEWLQSIELERDLTLADWKQAKEMEKEQIAKAFDDGDYNYHYSRKTGNDFEDGKEYFNEVYG
jgi:hypothetical protein